MSSKNRKSSARSALANFCIRVWSVETARARELMTISLSPLAICSSASSSSAYSNVLRTRSAIEQQVPSHSARTHPLDRRPNRPRQLSESRREPIVKVILLHVLVVKAADVHKGVRVIAKAHLPVATRRNRHDEVRAEALVVEQHLVAHVLIRLG